MALPYAIRDRHPFHDNTTIYSPCRGYYEQLNDLMPQIQPPVDYTKGLETPITTWSEKQVLLASDYLRKNSFQWLQAEPLEVRFTLNPISKVLTVIHAQGLYIDAGTFNVAGAELSGPQVFSAPIWNSEASAGYGIKFKNFRFNLCVEQMPTEIVQELNKVWLDPDSDGIIRDFTRMTVIQQANITTTAGNDVMFQIIQNDIHQLKQVIVMFRPAVNDSDITRDRYQLSDCTEWGSNCRQEHTGAGLELAQTYVSEFQIQIGTEFYPRQPMVIKPNMKNDVLFFANNIMQPGNQTFVSNQLTHEEFLGTVDFPMEMCDEGVQADSYTKFINYLGGAANKTFFGWDFSRHEKGLRAGISLDQRPMNFSIKFNAVPKKLYIPTVILFHEATLTIKASTTTLTT